MKAEDLRKSILQAAVQGKLVPQDKNDEPASELLKQIQQEKSRLIKEGKLKKKEPLPPIAVDETPYDLPDGWVWCRLGFIGDVRGGKRIPKGMSFSKYPTAHIYIRVTDMKDGTISDQNICYIGEDVFQQISRYTISKDDVYITIAGTIGECGIVPAKFDGMNLTENAAKLSIFGAYKDYIVNTIASPLVQAQFTEKTNQMAQPKLALERIKSTIIPFPPFSEQQRIVAKVDELMALCDKLESAENELDALENHLAEDLPKSILQAAVQGKLVPQNKNDEPASELLKRIHAEKATLIKTDKLKKEKPLPPITEDEIPYDLPEGWEWCRLNDLCVYIQRGKSPKYSSIMKIPVISQKCIQWDGFSISNAKFIDPDSISSYGEERILHEHDLLWNSTGMGTLGRIAMYEVHINPYNIAVTDSHVTVIRVMSKFIYPQYLLIYFTNPTVQSIIEEQASGTTKQKELATNTIKQYYIPLPPLTEQQRIVKKVDELMVLCKELKHVGDKPIDYSNVIPLPVHTPDAEYLQMVAQGKVTEVQSVKHRAAIKDLLKMMDDE